MHRTRRSNLPLESIRCDGSLLVLREWCGFDLDCREREGQVHASGQASVRAGRAAWSVAVPGSQRASKAGARIAGHRLEWLQCVSLLSDRSRVAKGHRRKIHGKNEKENDMHCNPSLTDKPRRLRADWLPE